MAKKAVIKPVEVTPPVEDIQQQPQEVIPEDTYPLYVFELVDNLSCAETHKKDVLLEMIKENKSKEEISQFLSTVMSTTTGVLFELKQYFNQ